MATARRGLVASMVALAVLVVVIVVLVKVVLGWLDGSGPMAAPVAEQCAVTVEGVTDSLDLDASRNAAIIVAESIRRGLPPRAASIALATAMQESKLHNIDYGDRDSMGLFQQRPSQGWGTAAQIMDPWYASGKFYDALVKVSGWQSGDINDVAQAVQHSGVPDGYRTHVAAAKAWASALTGQSPAAVSCVDRGTTTPDASAARDLITMAFAGTVTTTPGQAMLTIDSADSTRLWAATQLAMMTTKASGITHVAVGTQSWTQNGNAVATWSGTAPKNPTESVVTLRA